MTKNKKIINLSRRNIIENTFFNETAEIRLTANKILSVSAVSRMTSEEVLNGEIRVCGKIIAKIIYEHGEEKEISCYDYTKEFLLTVHIAEISSSDKAFIMSKITDIEYEGKDNLHIKFTLAIGGYYIKELPFEYLECDSADIIVKKSVLKSQRIFPLMDTTLQSSQNFEFPVEIKRILCYNSQSWINNAFPSDEMYQAEGEARTTIIALDMNNKLIQQSFLQSFNIEVPDSNILPDTDIMLDSFIKGTTIMMEEEGSKNIVIDLDILLRGSVSIYEENEILVDAYSIENEVVTKTASIVTENNLLCKTVSQTINSNIMVDEGKVKEIVACSPPLAGNINFVNDFGLFSEGIINTEIIYINENDELCSMKTEVPFQILVDKNFSASGVLNATLTVINTTASAISDQEISLTFETALNVKGASCEETTFMEDIQMGAPKEDNNVAISLYITKEGESLWDIAKSLSTDEQTLLNLNPDIKLPLKSGEKILLYRELKF